MRHHRLITLGLVTTLALAGSLAAADEGYRHGRLRYVEPGTTLQRATETEAEEAIQNLPFLPGDRIWTDDAGRAEFQFPDGTVVRMDRRGKLDYAGHEEDRGERVVVRVWSGSVIVHAPSRPTLRFEIETPAGFVEALEGAVVRVDVESGDTRVSVYEGEATFGGVQVRLGERVEARWGERPGEPEGFDRFEADDFLRWDQERTADERWAAESARHLPNELDEYAGEFGRNGDWRYEGGVSSYVWVPRVEVGWQPYSHGRWTWTAYGWTWVPYESWGWAPSHYGRWGYGASMGWYWIPGRTWGPAWVSWGVGGGYAAWCPLGWRDQPVTPWGRGGAYGGGHGGRAVPRQGFGRPVDGWNVVRQGELGRRGDIRRHRVDVARVDPGVLRVADSPLLRPTRDVAVLRPAEPAPRAIRTRPTPGDFVRELSVDNKTTIPAPWTRGYGPPPAGVEGARYGTPRSTDPNESRRPTSAVPRGGASSVQGEAPRAPEASGVTSSPRSAPRPAPWYAPRADSGGSVQPSPIGRAERRAPRPTDDGEATGDRPRRESTSTSTSRAGGSASRSDSGATGDPGAYRRRSEGTGEGYRPPQRGGGSDGGDRSQATGGGARPRPEGGGRGGGYRPQGDAGGAPRSAPSGGVSSAPRSAPSGGGAEARPSGSGHGGGERAVPRGRPNRE